MTEQEFFDKLEKCGHKFALDNLGMIRTIETDRPMCPIEAVGGRWNDRDGGLGLEQDLTTTIVNSSDRASWRWSTEMRHKLLYACKVG